MSLKHIDKKTKKEKVNLRFTQFRPMIRSRHPSHNVLRRALPLLPFRSVVRLGSTTTIEDNKPRVECNSVEGVRNSASKLLMKQCFTKAGVKTAPYVYGLSAEDTLRWAGEQDYPIISKSLYGSRGEGNQKHDNRESLATFLRNNSTHNYIFEKFVTMSREYRLHVTQSGCFYTCRKLLRNDAPEGTWQRHDDVVTWALETNASFKKPKNWNAIVADCIKAQKALGLDICAFDVMVQGSKDGREREKPEWIICESCSAPSFGEITSSRYIIEIPKILKQKHEGRI